MGGTVQTPEPKHVFAHDVLPCVDIHYDGKEPWLLAGRSIKHVLHMRLPAALTSSNGCKMQISSLKRFALELRCLLQMGAFKSGFRACIRPWADRTCAHLLDSSSLGASFLYVMLKLAAGQALPDAAVFEGLPWSKSSSA